MDDNSCLCKTKVTDSIVFESIETISKEDVFSDLFIGASGPQEGSVPSTGNGFIAHLVGGVIDEKTVFEVEDKGRTLFLKNVRSTVNLEGWKMNPRIVEAENAIIFNSVSFEFVMIDGSCPSAHLVLLLIHIQYFLIISYDTTATFLFNFTRPYLIQALPQEDPMSIMVPISLTWNGMSLSIIQENI